ncbi:type I 3-dehydroquinate dehydratase, partial [Escherichia coli]
VIVCLAGEVFGSEETFGAVKKAPAPGQISVTDFRTVLTILHQA